MITGIGIDTVEVARIQRFLDEGNQPLLDRLFSIDEQTGCMSKKKSAECLAGRFAAKEAFLKALGTGLRDGMSFCEISVSNDSLGKPLLSLDGKIKEKFEQSGASKTHLSISHDGGNAIAMVVLEA